MAVQTPPESPSVDTDRFVVHSISPTKVVLSESQEKAKNLGKLKTAMTSDVYSQLITRVVFVVFFLLLLAYQNYTVFNLVIKAQNDGKLDQLKEILGVLTYATLVETYFVIREIMKWLLKVIPYERYTRIMENKN